jgi:hypothetical protein
MRGYESDRPALNLLGVADDSGHIGSAGRHIQPIVGPDDEAQRERRLTPRTRREIPRALDEIFRS